MESGSSSFDGVLGTLGAPIMAWLNSDTEAEAVATLAPGSSDDVLVIGFGPGVGVRLLTDATAGTTGSVTPGRVAGVDPSAAMLWQANRRNRAARRAGRVDLRIGRADALHYPDASFDGVITVNTIQFWDPLPRSIAEVARVLRPGGRFVCYTHEWAIRRRGKPVDDWVAQTIGLFADHGLTGVRSWRTGARSGTSVALIAHRAVVSASRPATRPATRPAGRPAG